MHLPINLLEVSGALGTVVPLLAAIAKQDRLSKQVNTIIALIVSLVVAIVTCLVRNQWNPHDVIGSLIAIFTVGSATYHGFWNPVGLEPAWQSFSSKVLSRFGTNDQSRAELQFALDAAQYRLEQLTGSTTTTTTASGNATATATTTTTIEVPAPEPAASEPS